MGWKVLLAVGAVLLLGCGVVSAEVITIDKEPAQLIEVRKGYEAELKSVATPADIVKAQEEHEQEKKNLSKVEGYAQKLSVLEEAKKKEIDAINAKYLKEQEKLDGVARKALDEKHEKRMTELKSRSAVKASGNYQLVLEKLEKELIARNDLAGALMVQNERRKVSGAPPIHVAAPAVAPVAAPVAPAVAGPAPAAAPAPVPGGAKKTPQVHVSSLRGLAGTEGNVSNTVHTFTLDRISSDTKLVFYGYGNRTGNTYGTVYLIGPDGERSEVAKWRPELLKGPRAADFKSYTDVQPINADISSHVKRPGQYRVEFRYTDGDEALNIYRVEMQVL